MKCKNGANFCDDPTCPCGFSTTSTTRPVTAFDCECRGTNPCPFHGLRGPVGPGTPHARMEAMWERMSEHQDDVMRLTEYHPLKSFYPLEVAYVDAFEVLEVENQTLRAALAKLGVAFAELYSQGLNGVICDPGQDEVHRRNCRSCHEAWKAGIAVLEAYDPKFASLTRTGSMFQPDFPAGQTP